MKPIQKHKPKLYSYSRVGYYNGYDNEEILSLQNELNNCRSNLHRIKNAIEIIQNNCPHEYIFRSRCMYDDRYTCKKCGHDIVK